MSGVWGWFGGGAAKKKDTPKNAILGLRTQLEMLQKRERHLMNQMEEQDAIARKHVNTNKNGWFHPHYMRHSRRADRQLLTSHPQQPPKLPYGGRKYMNIV